MISFISQLVKETDTRIVIESRFDRCRTGEFIIYYGLTSGILALISLPFIEFTTAGLIIAAVSMFMAFIGLVVANGSEATTFIKKSKKILHQNKEYQYQQIHAVAAASFALGIENSNVVPQRNVYFIWLLAEDKNDTSVDIEKIVAELRLLSGKRQTQGVMQILEKIAIFSGLAEGSSGRMLCMGHGADLSVLHAALRAAQELNVPLVDVHSGRSTISKHDEVSLSLKQRLQKKCENINEPTERPSKVEVLTDSKGLRITWKQKMLKSDHIFITVMLIPLLLIVPSLIGLFIFFLVGALLYIPILTFLYFVGISLIGHGKNCITVTKQYVVIDLGFSKKISIDLSDIDFIRESVHVKDSITIIAGKKIKNIPISKKETSEWVIERIKYYLAVGM